MSKINLETPEEVWKVMLELSQDIGRQLRGYRLEATGVSIYIRESDIHYGLAKQSKLWYPTQSVMDIARAGFQLFQESQLYAAEQHQQHLDRYTVRHAVPRRNADRKQLRGSQ